MRGSICAEKKYPEWVIRQVFTQVKYINYSTFSSPTIKTIEVPTDKIKEVTKKHMLLILVQGDKDIGSTKSLKKCK